MTLFFLLLSFIPSLAFTFMPSGVMIRMGHTFAPSRLLASLDDSPSSFGSEAVSEDSPSDRCITLKASAITRLKELRSAPSEASKVLRMGVRSGGCSGLSYSMDFVAPDTVTEEDVVDEYPEVDDSFRCAVDAKSLLYLYGMELDYSTELIGGGFQFFNPNAEESCGCGKSFGV